MHAPLQCEAKYRGWYKFVSPPGIGLTSLVVKCTYAYTWIRVHSPLGHMKISCFRSRCTHFSSDHQENFYFLLNSMYWTFWVVVWGLEWIHWASYLDENTFFSNFGICLQDRKKLWYVKKTKFSGLGLKL